MGYSDTDYDLPTLGLHRWLLSTRINIGLQPGHHSQIRSDRARHAANYTTCGTN